MSGVSQVSVRLGYDNDIIKVKYHRYKFKTTNILIEYFKVTIKGIITNVIVKNIRKINRFTK